MTRRLTDVYADIPRIECKGLCHGSCGPVPATHAEIAAIERTSTHPWGVDQGGTCSMLAAGRCTVYVNRPLLCRLWGVTKKMPCPHGCVPERWLNDKESKALLEEVARIGGGYDLDRLAKMVEALAR